MKVEVDVLGSPSPIVRTVSVDVKQQKSTWPSWAPVPNKPTVSVDVKQHSTNLGRAQELCESRDGHPGFPVPNTVLTVLRSLISLMVSENGLEKPWARHCECELVWPSGKTLGW